MLDDPTAYAMDNINWSFSGDTGPGRQAYGLFDARSVHWYPATFIPEIPYSLIELLSQPGEKVLDPFAGIGTSLWQAQTLGREAFGAELTLVGQSICKDIWCLLASDTALDEAEDQVLSLLRRWDGVDFSAAFLASVRGTLLEPWFSRGTLKELAFIAAVEEMLPESAASHLLRLSLSGILASVCEQRAGWGCVADNVKPKPRDFAMAPPTRAPIQKLALRVKHVVRAVSATRNRLSYPGEAQSRSIDAATHFFSGDCVDSGALDREGFYDLVVTSPPYPGMVDYSTAHRLSYYWQGVLPERDVPREIGARRRRFGAKHLTDYTKEMNRALEAIGGSLKVGGLLAMVVPAFSTSRSLDPRFAAVQEVLHSAEATSMKLRWETDRVLPTSRRHLNQKWTSLERENIRVYERVR